MMRTRPQPVTAIEDGLVTHPDGVWGWWRIPTISYEWRSAEQRRRLAAQAGHALAGLRETVGHLYVLPRRYNPQAWADQLHRRTPNPTPGFDPYLAQVTDHLAGADYTRRQVFLGVRLADTGEAWWQTAARTGRRLLGVDDPTPPRQAVRERLRRRREGAHRVLAGGPLQARTATVEELVWLVQRAAWRGLGEPPASAGATQPWAGGGLRALYDVVVDEHYRHVTLDQPAGRAVHAWLTPARWPAELAIPGGEWLYQAALTAWPVEVSVRFELTPGHRAAGVVARRAAQATDQARHAAEAGRRIPIEVADADRAARTLQHRLRSQGEVLAYFWPRWCVWADTPEELGDAVEDLVETYRELGIELVRPAGVQLDLYDEALPCDKVRVASWRQEGLPVTLAGGLAHAAGDLGDAAGPYLGQTTGRARTAVHFDPLAAARRDMPTCIAVTGVQGGGKTTTARLLLYQAALRGAAVLSLDPKEEPGGLQDLDGLDDVQILDLSDAPAGLLDPYSVADDDQRAAVAVETLTQLVAQPLDGTEEALLVQACQAEADRTDRPPSLSGVLDRLRDDSGHDIGRRLATRLGQYTSLPLARLCFAAGAGTRLRLDGVTEIRFGPGLAFPEGGGSRQRMHIRQRLALALLHLLAELTRRLIDLDRDRPKLIAIDEAWALTTTPAGQDLIQRLSRLGRARNTAVLLISQQATDLTHPAVRNAISAVFAFRAGSDAEAAAVLDLLGVEDTADHRAAVAGLQTGECVMRDLDGRTGTVYIDRVTAELRAALDTTPGRPEPAAVP